MYTYSMREKTHAHRQYVDDVPEEVKHRRLREVRACPGEVLAGCVVVGGTARGVKPAWKVVVGLMACSWLGMCTLYLYAHLVA